MMVPFKIIVIMSKLVLYHHDKTKKGIKSLKTCIIYPLYLFDVVNSRMFF